MATDKHNIIVTGFERMQHDLAKELRRGTACLAISTTDTAIRDAVDASRWSNVSKNIEADGKAAIWRGHSGSGAEIFSADLLDWIRKQEATYLPDVELLLDPTA